MRGLCGMTGMGRRALGLGILSLIRIGVRSGTPGRAAAGLLARVAASVLGACAMRDHCCCKNHGDLFHALLVFKIGFLRLIIFAH